MEVSCGIPERINRMAPVYMQNVNILGSGWKIEIKYFVGGV